MERSRNRRGCPGAGRSAFAIASAFLLSGAAAFAGEGYRLYNIVPMYIGHEAEQAAKCVEMYERTGVDLALYSLTLHPEGRPASAKVDRYVASYRAFAQALKGAKVRPAILVQAILGHWPRTDKDVEPWERTVDQDGKAVRFCPRDPGFAAYIDETFRKLAAEKPAFILTDDDVRAYSHGAECFCALHVKIFNARHGTDHTSGSLRAAVAAAKPGEAVYDDFLAMQREMMREDVVGRIRRAIDAVDPTIPAGICVAGEEHYLCAPLARAIAAKGQVPVLRCSTGNYCERMSAASFPPTYGRMLGFTAYYGDSGIRLLDEADTCPQNLWSKGARSLMTHLVASCFTGMAGAKTWYVNAIRADGTPVTRRYTDELARKRGYLDALACAVAGSRMTGLAVPCFTNHPNWHAVRNHGEFLVERDTVLEAAAVPFGVPVCASNDFGDRRLVFALSTAQEVARLGDADVRTLLSGRVLLLRDAALALAKRGYSDLTGFSVEVSPRTEDGAEMPPLTFNAERDNATGAMMGYSLASVGNVRIRINDGAERLSDFVFRPYAGASEIETVAPATIVFRNRLGGVVLTTAYHVGMFSLHRYSAARKRWFVRLVDRLSGTRRPLVCENDQDVLVSVREKPDGTRLVLAVNLGTDPIEDLRLRLPAGAFYETLSCDGTWRPVKGPLALGFYEAAVFCVSDCGLHEATNRRGVGSGFFADLTD